MKLKRTQGCSAASGEDVGGWYRVIWVIIQGILKTLALQGESDWAVGAVMARCVKARTAATRRWYMVCLYSGGVAARVYVVGFKGRSSQFDMFLGGL